MVASDLPEELIALAGRIAQALQQEADRFSAAGKAPRIELAPLQFVRVIDPSNHEPGFEAVWRNVRNERCGSLTINSDGSYYAEYDLFCPDPRDERWFVEMVMAWGVGDALRCEAKMIPAP